MSTKDEEIHRTKCTNNFSVHWTQMPAWLQCIIPKMPNLHQEQTNKPRLNIFSCFNFLGHVVSVSKCIIKLSFFFALKPLLLPGMQKPIHLTVCFFFKRNLMHSMVTPPKHGALLSLPFHRGCRYTVNGSLIHLRVSFPLTLVLTSYVWLATHSKCQHILKLGSVSSNHFMISSKLNTMSHFCNTFRINVFVMLEAFKTWRPCFLFFLSRWR